MSHNVKSPLHHIQIFWICSSETFVLIRVIENLIQRACRVVLLLLQLVRRADNRFGYGSGYLLNFFVLHNFVSFARRNMCNTPNQSCVLWLHFFFSRLRSLSNLWGRYDLKTKILQFFGL